MTKPTEVFGTQMVKLPKRRFGEITPTGAGFVVPRATGCVKNGPVFQQLQPLVKTVKLARFVKLLIWPGDQRQLHLFGESFAKDWSWRFRIWRDGWVWPGRVGGCRA
jgi:hypothetical protein